jgi:hypothetical protein
MFIVFRCSRFYHFYSSKNEFIIVTFALNSPENKLAVHQPCSKLNDVALSTFPSAQNITNEKYNRPV